MLRGRAAQMEIFDKDFRKNKARYLLQCCLAGAAMLVILGGMRSISNSAVVASLGASTFIVFALPNIKASRSQFLIGGYIVGVAAGVLCFWLKQLVPLPEQLGMVTDVPNTVFGAAAVGLSALGMVIANAEHPPAAGLALGFALLDKLHWEAPAVVMAGIIALCLVRLLLRPYLRNLI